MNLSLSQCFAIVHDDADRALAFYRDTLGLEQRSDVGKGNLVRIDHPLAG